MRSPGKFIASFAAFSLLASSSVVVAAAPTPQAPVTQPQAPNAWMMLSVLSPTRSVALGGTAAAAQPADVPPPPGHEAAGVTGEFLPVVLWFGLIAIALATSGGGSGAAAPRPNSPA